MKISRPTNDTITSMTAVRGSRTQPSSSHTSPNWNQRKLKTCRDTSPFPECCKAFAKATQDKIRATPIEPIASEAANLRCRCFAKEETPAANSGKAGMSQRYRTIQFNLRKGPSIEANPEGIAASSPGLRGTSYPGKLRKRSLQPQRGCVYVVTRRHNPVWVADLRREDPRVARASQPWALFRNPFGILPKRTHVFSSVTLSSNLSGPHWPFCN